MQIAKTPFVQTKKFGIMIASVALVAALVSGIYLGQFAVSSNLNTNMHLRGIVQVTVKDANGTIVSQTQNDTIYPIAYDYIICYIFGVGCAQVAGMDFPLTTTFTTTATISAFQPYMTFATGMVLSSGTQSNGACSNIIGSNGLTAAVASSVSHFYNTNQVLLTNSWTATGSQNVQSICLLPAQQNSFIPQFSNAVITGAASIASENFSVQSLTAGQSITIQWTFSF